MYNPQLETFLRVADAGSFNKAAEESYITPTAVIKQINLLEESLGVKLFDRSHRGLTLTKAGRSMYQDAKYIIRYCRDSVTRAKNAMQEDENIIRIGSSPMTPAQLLMELWSRVQTLHPDIKFQIVPFENTPENAREILANLGKNIDVDVEEMEQDKRGLATYEQIKDYVLERSGLKVSSLYIAQVKQKHGIIERENYNKPKSENAKQPQCPPDKERAITEALKHFGML